MSISSSITILKSLIFVKLFGVERYIADLLGRPVDLLTVPGFIPTFGPNIEAESRPGVLMKRAVVGQDIFRLT
ncbi:MAG: hypothetical protein WB822_14685 [Rhodoplanes sp.]